MLLIGNFVISLQSFYPSTSSIRQTEITTRIVKEQDFSHYFSFKNNLLCQIFGYLLCIKYCTTDTGKQAHSHYPQGAFTATETNTQVIFTQYSKYCGGGRHKVSWEHRGVEKWGTKDARFCRQARDATAVESELAKPENGFPDRGKSKPTHGYRSLSVHYEATLLNILRLLSH